MLGEVYSPLFQIRKTRRISLHPVGHLVETAVSSPIVKHGQIVDFIDPWKGTSNTQCIHAVSYCKRLLTHQYMSIWKVQCAGRDSGIVQHPGTEWAQNHYPTIIFVSRSWLAYARTSKFGMLVHTTKPNNTFVHLTLRWPSADLEMQKNHPQIRAIHFLCNFNLLNRHNFGILKPYDLSI